NPNPISLIHFSGATPVGFWPPPPAAVANTTPPLPSHQHLHPTTIITITLTLSTFISITIAATQPSSTPPHHRPHHTTTIIIISSPAGTLTMPPPTAITTKRVRLIYRNAKRVFVSVAASTSVRLGCSRPTRQSRFGAFGLAKITTRVRLVQQKCTWGAFGWLFDSKECVWIAPRGAFGYGFNSSRSVWVSRNALRMRLVVQERTKGAFGCAETPTRVVLLYLVLSYYEVTPPDIFPLRPILGVLQIGIQSQGLGAVPACTTLSTSSRELMRLDWQKSPQGCVWFSRNAHGVRLVGCLTARSVLGEQENRKGAFGLAVNSNMGVWFSRLHQGVHLVESSMMDNLCWFHRCDDDDNRVLPSYSLSSKDIFEIPDVLHQ
nr:hypothetical protein [Tanacetum cinerariifolium]